MKDYFDKNNPEIPIGIMPSEDCGIKGDFLSGKIIEKHSKSTFRKSNKVY